MQRFTTAYARMRIVSGCVSTLTSWEFVQANLLIDLPRFASSHFLGSDRCWELDMYTSHKVSSFTNIYTTTNIGNNV